MYGSGVDYLCSNYSHGIMVGAGGTLLHVYGWTTIEIDGRGSQSVVIVNPLATEAILGLDVLKDCIIDLSHEQLITGAGHVVTLHSPVSHKLKYLRNINGLQLNRITQHPIAVGGLKIYRNL